jgi:predicted nucleic-acid-binding Zn-ribbon protein
MMICAKCGNTTRTSALVTAAGPVMLAGTLNTDQQPIEAQVCTACGYIELYAPQPIGETQFEKREVLEEPTLTPVPTALPA